MPKGLTHSLSMPFHSFLASAPRPLPRVLDKQGNGEQGWGNWWPVLSLGRGAVGRETFLVSARALLGLRFQARPAQSLSNFLSKFPVHVGVLPAGLAALPTGHMQFTLATGGPSKGQPAANRLGVA